MDIIIIAVGIIVVGITVVTVGSITVGSITTHRVILVLVRREVTATNTGKATHTVMHTATGIVGIVVIVVIVVMKVEAVRPRV